MKMKKNFLFVFLLSLVSFTSYAQVSDTNDNILLKKALTSFEQEDYEKSLNYYLEAAEKTSGGKDQLRMYVRLQIGAAQCYGKLKRYEDAYNTASKLLDLKLTEDEKNEAVSVMLDYGLIFATEPKARNVKKYDVSRAVCEKLLPYAKGDRVKQIKDEIQSTYLIEGKLKLDKLDFTGAVETLKKAYTISDNAENRIQILFDIAQLNSETGNISLSLDCYEEMRRLCRIVKDDYHHYLALKHGREIFKKLNDMEKFTSWGMTLDSLMYKSDNVSILGDYYLSMGNELVELGNYDAAGSYFNSHAELISKIKNEEAKLGQKITYYSNMRDLKRKQKDYHSAIEYNAKLAKCFSKIYDNSNFTHYLSYLVDTQLYSEIKDSVNFERVADSLRHAYTYIPDLFNKSLVCNFIGTGYSKLGKRERAMHYYYKADSILSQQYDETFHLRITMLELRAGELKKMGRTAEACKLYKHAMDLVAKVSGKKSEQYSRALYMYANSLRADGKMENNSELYIQSIKILENILRQKLRYILATDRQVYINTLSDRLWRMATFVLDYKDVDREFVKQCYNTTIMLKSLLFESDRSMYNTLQLKGTKEDVDDFIRMSSLRMQRNSLFRNYRKNKELIDSLQVQIRELDNKLTEKSKLYSGYTSFLDFSYDDVCKHLGDKDVMFDFFDYIDDRGAHKYIAYVVKKDMKTPEVLKVFDESQVDSIMKGYGMDVFYDESISEDVLKLLWNPIAKYAEKGGRVYYVPSGIMYQISLGSLPLSDGSLLGEHYDFVRLTSAHRIADNQTSTTDKKDAVIYGGLRYDLDIDDMQAESKKFDHEKLYAMRNMAKGAKKFAYLPGTLSETEEIAKILTKKGYDVTRYTEGKGTEESFLNMHNNSPRILHIATHGFYYTPEEADRSNYLKGSNDAMFLSGLVLSGGNAAWQGEKLPDNVLGGIVSAGNISCLDLSNIDLVVLSACQSAQGKVTREGLFGLQRAFKKAGVKTIVMTLWNVSDVVTRQFMIEFYKNLFKKNDNQVDKKKAFMKAMRTVRKKYPEPFYWAGFVMVD